jgi:hypothetical protein
MDSCTHIDPLDQDCPFCGAKAPVKLTPAQEVTLQEINDKWGVAKWEKSDDPEIILVTCDDGDTCLMYADGDFVWDFTG